MKKILFLFSLLLVLVGCSDNSKNEKQAIDLKGKNISYTILTSENVVPLDMEKHVFTREEPPTFEYVVKLGRNKNEFSELWNLFQLESDMPEIDFDKKNVLFINMTENSCAVDVIDMTIHEDGKMVELYVDKKTKELACSDIAIPRTFALAIGKEDSTSVNSIVLHEGNYITEIPLTNPR